MDFDIYDTDSARYFYQSKRSVGGNNQKHQQSATRLLHIDTKKKKKKKESEIPIISYCITIVKYNNVLCFVCLWSD
jgi:hypothetical protein